MKKCPYCLEDLPKAHISICPHCEEVLIESEKEQDPQNKQSVDWTNIEKDSMYWNMKSVTADVAEYENSIVRVHCPYCDELISSRAKKCRYCSEYLVWKNIPSDTDSLQSRLKDMSFWWCVKRWFASLWNTKDRATRKEFWSYYSFVVLVLLLSWILIWSAFFETKKDYDGLWSILFILEIVFTFAISVRRMNDASNYHTLIRYIPHLRVLLLCLLLLITVIIVSAPGGLKFTNNAILMLFSVIGILWLLMQLIFWIYILMPSRGKST